MSSIVKKQEAVTNVPLSLKKLSKRLTVPKAQASTVGNLPATIQLFQTITEQLTDSYESLTLQVESLRGELALADQALTKELHAKESISERMEKLLAAMPVAVITLDSRGYVDDANPAALEMLGKTITGRKWVNIIDEVFCDTTVCGHELLLKSGRVASIATQPLSDKGGQVVVLTDLTETRHLQNKINHLEKLSEMGRMMASLAHQIRTPLSSAMIFAEHLVAGEKVESRKKRYANRIMEKLTQLDRQVRDMLIFSKSGFLMADRINAQTLLDNLEQVANEILEPKKGELQVIGQCSKKATLQCNRVYLVSAFCNLIENAVQACDEQGIEPRLTLRADTSNPSLLTLTLTDNGPGVTQDKMSKIMEPFYTTKASGTGLGLPVVYAVMAGHGGAMDLYNAEEGGLVIRVQLPLAHSNNAQHS